VPGASLDNGTKRRMILSIKYQYPDIDYPCRSKRRMRSAGVSPASRRPSGQTASRAMQQLQVARPPQREDCARLMGLSIPGSLTDCDTLSVIIVSVASASWLADRSIDDIIHDHASDEGCRSPDLLVPAHTMTGLIGDSGYHITTLDDAIGVPASATRITVRCNLAMLNTPKRVQR